MRFTEDGRDEMCLDERQHQDAMIFLSQCMWRDYEEMIAGPHSKRSADMLLWEIGVLEANLTDMGVYAT